MIEILIAMFIFLIGILGVLSMFPVAMSSAARSIGQVRGNILAQSALAQLTADCRVAHVEGTVLNIPAANLLDCSSAFVDDERNGYFVTIISSSTPPGAAHWQSRLIIDTEALNSRLTVCPDWNPQPVAGDEFIITRMGLPWFPTGLVDGTNTITTTLVAQAGGATWADGEWDGYNVRILSGIHEGELHLITATTNPYTLALSPGWAAGDEPADGVRFAIVNDAPRSGFVRDIDGDTIYAGEANGEDVDVLTWPTGISWYESPVASDNCPAADSDASLLVVTDTDAALAEQGHLAVIRGDPVSNPAAGQVRLITSGGASPLNVFPDWEVLPQTGDAYEIRERLGYFLVITSGRSAGRIFPITNYSKDAGTGDHITCEGANFREIGVTEAKRATGGPDEFKLRNATGFMIVGSESLLCTVINHAGTGSVPVPLTPSPAYYRYLLNSLGLPKTAEPQTGADVYRNATGETYGSEYSSVCVFSDNGALPNGAVRVDVFAFRNFNTAEDLVENRKPVGFLTGYIGRP